MGRRGAGTLPAGDADPADGPTRSATAPGWPDRTIVAGFMLVGIAAYVAAARGVLAPPGTDLFGRFIYNYYFLSLIEGRFDVPLRVVTLEGHYATDGTAYVYHGVAPLLSRLVAWPFVDLREVPLARASVCAFAIIGTLTYHWLLSRLIFASSASGAVRRTALVAGGAAIWFAGPGLLLAANGTLYNEPISVGYAAVAIWIALLIHVIHFKTPIGTVLIPAALCVAILLHARVHVAVGLGVGSFLLGLAYLRQQGLPVLREMRVWAAVALVVLSGAGFLALNQMRFGDPFQVSGANDAFGNVVEYGFSYWSEVLGRTPTFDAFAQGGTFYWPRIVPNALLYAFDFPETVVSDRILDLYRAMTSHLGPIRIENPRIGFAFLWAPWIAVILCSAGFWRAARPTAAAGPAVALVAGAAIAALFMFSYGTVTLRYRVDVWPVVIALAVLALPACLAALETGGTWRRGLMALALAGGLAMSLATAVAYSKVSREQDLFALWDRATCEEMVLARGFAEGDLDRLCGL